VIRYECDKCGAALGANDAGRYIVKMEVYAAAEHLDISEQDLAGTTLDDVLQQLRDADPDEVEDQTYRSFRFDVCDACRRRLLQRPLG